MSPIFSVMSTVIISKVVLIKDFIIIVVMSLKQLQVYLPLAS
jgi:hypothetical protein